MIVEADWTVLAVAKTRSGAVISVLNEPTGDTTVFNIGNHTQRGIAFIESLEEGTIIRSTLEITP